MVVFNVVLERKAAVAVAVDGGDGDGGDGANKGDAQDVAEEDFAEATAGCLSPVCVEANLLWRKDRGSISV